MTTPSTREHLIAAGMRIVLKKGYNSAGIQEITASAGLPRGAFYSYFENKEALGAELVRQYGRPAQGALAWPTGRSRRSSVCDVISRRRTIITSERITNGAAYSAISAPSLPISARSSARGWPRFLPTGRRTSSRRSARHNETRRSQRMLTPDVWRFFFWIPMRAQFCAPESKRAGMRSMRS